jgi:heme A synthase
MLAVGQMVTSFRAGMADPVWPTEPWYLISNYKLDLGYLIEHSHRILGWILGGLITVLVVVLMAGERCAKTKWAGLLGIVVLLGGYGEFHKGLIAQRDTPASEVKLPMAGTVVTLAGLAIALGSTTYALLTRSCGARIRMLGVTALAAVMVQGLLGGFRVKLNELVGTDLAAVHGVFAQIVFGLLVSLAVLTARSPALARASTLVRVGAVVVAVTLFVQVVWGAVVRHAPTVLSQKMHFLTAFLATGFVVWLVLRVVTDPVAKGRVRVGVHLLSALLLLQVGLGVEAWMEKFGQEGVPHYLVPVTKTNAAIRTLHALVGSALLATAVGLAVRVRQRGASPAPRTEDGETVAAAGADRPVLVGAGASQPGDPTC